LVILVGEQSTEMIGEEVAVARVYPVDIILLRRSNSPPPMFLLPVNKPFFFTIRLAFTRSTYMGKRKLSINNVEMFKLPSHTRDLESLHT